MVGLKLVKNSVAPVMFGSQLRVLLKIVCKENLGAVSAASPYQWEAGICILPNKGMEL